MPEQREDDEQLRLREVAEAQPPYAAFLGSRLLSWSREAVEAELVVRPELANRNGVLHGGALMGFADNLGGTSASLHLRPGTATTTVQSGTHFLRAARVGSTLRGRCVPVHVGRTTSVWQTTVTDEQGRTVAVVTQTQLTLTPDG